MSDCIGYFLKSTPHFRSKWRLQRIWERLIKKNEVRVAQLPDKSLVNTNLSIPYERMVWLQAEEWDELRYLQKKLVPGNTFIDVGANIGLWTLVAASTVGPQGKVLSFEPNPTTFGKLTANISLNGYSNIEVFPAAVSSKNGFVSFACREDHNISGIVEDTHVEEIVQVASKSLDSIVNAPEIKQRITGIKLDTEGHELAALKGALELIKADSPWLIVEFNTTLLPSSILKDWVVYEFLCSIGYKAYFYTKHFEEVAVDGSFSVSGYMNILFKR